jgi:hypothetical protein
MKISSKLWLAVFLLALLSPLGLVLPALFKAGGPFGEARLPGGWHAPLTDYAPGGSEGKGLAQLSWGYIFSAAAGVVCIAAVFMLFGRFLTKRGGSDVS